MSPVLIAASFGAVRVVAKSSLLIAVAWGVARLLHRSTASARHVVWLTAFVGVLLTPALDRLVVVPVPVPTQLRLLAPMSAIWNVELSGPGRRATKETPSARVLAEKIAPPSHRMTLAEGLAAIWALVALLLLVRLSVARVRVRRLAQRARAVGEPTWTAVLDESARRLGIHIVPRLVMSNEVDAAFTFDALSPAIVLPAAANEWPVDRRRSVLLHELAHVRRRDLIGHGIAGLACAVSWFNPLVWVAATHLRVESELASDDIVLDAGIRPSAYAQHLLDLVTSMSRRAPSVAVAMARPKELEGRLIAILDPIRQTAAARRQGALVAAVLGLCAISIGAMMPVPRVSGTAVDGAPHVAVPAAHDEAARDATPVQPPQNDVAPPSAAFHHVSTPGLSSEAVASLLRYGTSGIMNPMIMLLREADSLGLSAAQADSIATLNRRYVMRLSGIWSPVSSYLLAHPNARDEYAVRIGTEAQRETAAALADMLPGIENVLTPEQRSRVSPRTAAYLDPRSLDAATATSGGVFVPADRLNELRGRGRGGG